MFAIYEYESWLLFNGSGNFIYLNNEVEILIFILKEVGN